METIPTKKSPTTAIILIVVIIIILAILLLTRKKTPTLDTIPPEGVTGAELQTIEQTNDQQALSENNDLDTIESDLNATNFSSLETDLGSF